MLPVTLQILLVEDNAGDARFIHELLTKDEYDGPFYYLTHVTSLNAAIAASQKELFDAVLLDLNLSDSRGLSTVQALNAKFPDLPIIVLTGVQDERIALQSVQKGAQDYINKEECSRPLLKRLIHYAIERKKVEQHLRQLATFDSATGLPNRTTFYQRLSYFIQQAQHQGGVNMQRKAAVMLMELTNFTQINRKVGYMQGDVILRRVARQLQLSLHEPNIVAHLGEGRFVFLIEGLASQSDCVAMAEGFLRSLNQPLTAIEIEIPTQASIGISIFPDDDSDMETLIHFATLAMQTAREKKISVSFYQPGSAS